MVRVINLGNQGVRVQPGPIKIGFTQTKYLKQFFEPDQTNSKNIFFNPNQF